MRAWVGITDEDWFLPNRQFLEWHNEAVFKS